MAMAMAMERLLWRVCVFSDEDDEDDDDDACDAVKGCQGRAYRRHSETRYRGCLTQMGVHSYSF